MDRFVKQSPWTPVSMLDVCSGKLEHLNLKHVVGIGTCNKLLQPPVYNPLPFKGWLHERVRYLVMEHYENEHSDHIMYFLLC